ncbi:MAG: hypothetical protein ACOVQX_00945 [Legionella sp.]
MFKKLIVTSAYNIYRFISGLLGGLFYPVYILVKLFLFYVRKVGFALFSILAVSIALAGHVYDLGILAGFALFVVAIASGLAVTLVFSPTSFLLAVMIGIKNALVDGFSCAFNAGLGQLYNKMSWSSKDDEVFDLIFGVGWTQGLAASTQKIISSLLVADIYTAAQTYLEVKDNPLKGLYLSAEDREKMVHDHQQLPDLVKQQLNLKNDPIVQELLNEHKSLMAELAKEEDDIDFESINTANAIVLMKQFYTEGEWYPVKGGTYLCTHKILTKYASSGEALKHPVHGEDLVNPKPMEIDNVIRATRYRCHPYYLSGANHGFSQRLNLLTKMLLQKLPEQQAILHDSFADYEHEMKSSF